MADYNWISITRQSIQARHSFQKSLKGKWKSFAFGVLITAILMMGMFYTALINAQTIPHSAKQYQRDLIRTTRHVWGLGSPVASFAAQIHQESGWRADAKSHAGALGLTQFMPTTATWISGVYQHELGNPDPLNPRWAMLAMARYMKFLYERVSGLDHCEQYAFALAAYNGGLGWVNKRKKLSEFPTICFAATCDINPGITPANQRENSGYPKRILLLLEPVYIRGGFGTGVCH